MKTPNSYSIVHENVDMNNNNDIRNLFNSYFINLGRMHSNGIVHNNVDPLRTWEKGVQIIFSSTEWNQMK